MSFAEHHHIESS